MKHRRFVGQQLLGLRNRHDLKQGELASRLGISVSYLSQLEHDDRPLTSTLEAALQNAFPLDWRSETGDGTTRRIAALKEVMADPLFSNPIGIDQIARLAEQHTQIADQFIALHAAYRHVGQRLQIVDEALSTDAAGGGRLPWEEVRDWFHHAGNYVDRIDREAEALALSLSQRDASPTTDALERHLRTALAVSVIYDGHGGFRNFDPEMRHLSIDVGQPVESQRFQLAHQLAALAFKNEIAAVVEEAKLRSAAARQLLFIGLSNYAAGALLMPYQAFRDMARSVRHDIDRLRQHFGVSFEQACHRLSTLQRPDARGVPFFFCRVDMAGNITKRHSATRLQFARFGGACPLWIVHEAVAIPDRILVQLAETPDGVRYVSMAKGLVKPTGSYDRSPRRYAVGLGCEIEHAREFVYADGFDIHAERAAVPIGVSCRLCPRPDCDQRAFPPSDRTITINPDQRTAVPYTIDPL